MLFLSEMVDLRWNLSASVARAYDGTNATRDKGSATEIGAATGHRETEQEVRMCRDTDDYP
jgi:hypothetical protein